MGLPALKNIFQNKTGPRAYPKIRLYRQGELSPVMVIVVSAIVSFALLLLVFLWLYMANPTTGPLVILALFGPFVVASVAAFVYDRMLKDRIRRSGRSTDACVIDMWLEHEANESGNEATEGTFYMVAYQFSVGLGSQAHTLTLQESVKEDIYNQLNEGQTVRIFYIEDQPEVALVDYFPKGS